MEEMQGNDESRAQLDQWMDERRLELRLTWRQVARKAGMSTQNLLRIRKGEISISWNAADGIEDALRWPRGSIEAAVTRAERPAGLPAGESPESSVPPVTSREPMKGGDPQGEPRVMTPAQMYAALEQAGWTIEQEEKFQALKRDLAAQGLTLTPAIYLTMRRLNEGEQRKPQTTPNDDGK